MPPFFTSHHKISKNWVQNITDYVKKQQIDWLTKQVNEAKVQANNLKSVLKNTYLNLLSQKSQEMHDRLSMLLSELDVLQEAYTNHQKNSTDWKAKRQLYITLTAIEKKLNTIQQTVKTTNLNGHYISTAISILVKKESVFNISEATNPLKNRAVCQKIDDLCSKIKDIIDPLHIKTAAEFNTVMALFTLKERETLFNNLRNSGRIAALIRDSSDLTTILTHLTQEQRQQVKLMRYSEDKRKTMSHVLGLKNPVGASKAFGEHEGFDLKSANQSSKTRFQRLHNNKETSLQLDLVKTGSNFQTLTEFGSYQGIHAKWYRDKTGHAFTFFQIQAGDQIHLIYINKGERHRDQDLLRLSSVMVFSLPKEKAQTILNNLDGVLQSEDREKIGGYLESLGPYINFDIMNEMPKKDQKVGNCSVANSNIAWHVHLASKYMQQHQVGFIEAYKATLPQYKALRKQDRTNAFTFLFTVAKQHLYETQNTFHEDLFFTLFKFYTKEQQPHKGQIILPTIEGLIKDEPSNGRQLFQSLWDKSFIRIGKEQLYKTNPMHFKNNDTLQTDIDLLFACFQLEWATQLHTFMIKNKVDPAEESARQDKINELKISLLKQLPEKDAFIRSFAPSLKSDPHFLTNGPSYFETIVQQDPNNYQLAKWAYLFDPNVIQFTGLATTYEIVTGNTEVFHRLTLQKQIDLVALFPDLLKTLPFIANQQTNFYEKMVESYPNNINLVHFAYQHAPSSLNWATPEIFHYFISTDINACKYLDQHKILKAARKFPNLFKNKLQTLETLHPGILANFEDSTLLKIIESGTNDLSFSPALAHRVVQYCLAKLALDEDRKQVLITKIMGPLEQVEKQQAMKSEFTSLREHADTSELSKENTEIIKNS